MEYGGYGDDSSSWAGGLLVGTLIDFENSHLLFWHMQAGAWYGHLGGFFVCRQVLLGSLPLHVTTIMEILLLVYRLLL